VACRYNGRKTRKGKYFFADVISEAGRVKQLKLLAAVFALVLASIATAQDAGQVTGLPIPRFVSMKSGSANVRRGPSTSNRVDWVLRHRGTPLIVRAEYQDWFRVEDVDGEGGWVHTKLLSTRRTVLVQEDLLALRERPATSARKLARLEAGVVARLGACQENWCEASIDGFTGWLPKSGIWGVLSDEEFE
jgi:SH3-like domain-containing protein